MIQVFNNDDTPDVKALIARLKRGLTIRESFKLKMTTEQAKAYIFAGIYCELAQRGHTYQKSQQMTQYITQAAKWLTTEDYPALLLCGMPGNGKTTLMNAVRMVINDCAIKSIYGERVECYTYNAKDVAYWNKSNYQKFKEICSRPILAIDDIGTEPASLLEYGNTLNPIIDLITHRYDQQLMTIMTTNLTPPQLREKYGARIADRLNEFADKIVFETPSYRGNTQQIAAQPLK